jgi:Cu/Ag efflux protein CusF
MSATLIHHLLVATAATCAATAVLAQAPASRPTAAVEAPHQVYTRGEFRGTSEEEGGRRLYAHIKLAPGHKIPFSTLAYRVPDRTLLTGVQQGAAVEFLAKRQDGENVLTAIRPAAPCGTSGRCK